MAVPSPCINVCTLDPVSGLCRGCARTLQEISDWPRLDDAGKREVWARIRQRRSAAAEATQGEDEVLPRAAGPASPAESG